MGACDGQKIENEKGRSARLGNELCIEVQVPVESRSRQQMADSLELELQAVWVVSYPVWVLSQTWVFYKNSAHS